MNQVPPVDFELDAFQLVLLSRGDKAGELDQETVDRLSLEHVQHNLGLQADGLLLAAGAVVGATATKNAESDQPLVGLGFWRLPAEVVAGLMESDPGVRAGLYRAELVQFMCPKGALQFEEEG